MNRSKLFFAALALFVVFVMTACAPAAVPPDAGDDQAAIDAAVQATLTAVAQSQPAAAPTAASEAETPTPEDPAPTATPVTAPAAAQIVLPPEVPNFDSPINPAKTRGEADAPIVFYEWSDYT